MARFATPSGQYGLAGAPLLAWLALFAAEPTHDPTRRWEVER